MEVLRRYGVDRVSVNPQSMEDEVLCAMGRAHTAEDIKTAYRIVRDSRLPAVNMDLIAGLPRDTVEGFRYTLDAVLAMDPENITVHTLALKKGSRLMMERQGLPSGEETARMLDYAWETLARVGYRPYYLYRQKYMSGALENIGWCRPGFEGLYNVCIMEELHSIVALGAGGSTKLTDPDTGKIVRITNPKYPYEYIGRIEAICREKEDFGMKKRNFVYFFGALFVFCLLLFGAPRRAEAAYTVSYNSDGSATLKNQSTGGTVAKLSVKGERIGKGIVVTSKNVFYLSYSVGQSKNTYSIIQQNLSTGSKKRLIRLTTALGQYRRIGRHAIYRVKFIDFLNLVNVGIVNNEFHDMFLPILIQMLNNNHI